MPKIKEIEDFVKYQKHLNKSESTINSYKNDIIVFARWFDQVNHYSFVIHKVTPTDIRLYKQYLIDNEFKPNCQAPVILVHPSVNQNGPLTLIIFHFFVILHFKFWCKIFTIRFSF